MNADAHKASVVYTLNLIMSFILLQTDDLTPIHSHSDNRTVKLIIYLADLEQQNICLGSLPLYLYSPVETRRPSTGASIFRKGLFCGQQNF